VDPTIDLLESDGDETTWCFPCEIDAERLYNALAEVGLEPTESGGGWFGWDRELTTDEIRMTRRAVEISR